MMIFLPDRDEHLVRYYGWYSNRSRGERNGSEPESTPIPSDDTIEPDTEFSQAARGAWARLIKKVYEVDPLICQHCGGEMRFLAVIEETPVIERILRHVGVWNPTPPLRALPVEENWPDNR